MKIKVSLRIEAAGHIIEKTAEAETTDGLFLGGEGSTTEADTASEMAASLFKTLSAKETA